jgi:hypothetical protein
MCWQDNKHIRLHNSINSSEWYNEKLDKIIKQKKKEQKEEIEITEKKEKRRR